MNPDPSSALFVTMLLIGFNAFFVAAEFALVKVRQSQLAIKEKDGHPTAKLARHIVENLEKYLSATQLAITGAGLALGWVGQDAIGSLLSKIL
jgi:CBS domain containing-hemolysin-like protein